MPRIAWIASFCCWAVLVCSSCSSADPSDGAAGAPIRVDVSGVDSLSTNLPYQLYSAIRDGDTRTVDRVLPHCSNVVESAFLFSVLVWATDNSATDLRASVVESLRTNLFACGRMEVLRDRIDKSQGDEIRFETPLGPLLLRAFETSDCRMLEIKGLTETKPLFAMSLRPPYTTVTLELQDVLEPHGRNPTGRALPGNVLGSGPKEGIRGYQGQP